jgi:hypothetical protein
MKMENSLTFQKKIGVVNRIASKDVHTSISRTHKWAVLYGKGDFVGVIKITDLRTA